MVKEREDIKCLKCFDTGIAAHGIDPVTNKSVRFPCECEKGQKRKKPKVLAVLNVKRTAR